jgi:hypothetical protein
MLRNTTEDRDVEESCPKFEMHRWVDRLAWEVVPSGVFGIIMKLICHH